MTSCNLCENPFPYWCEACYNEVTLEDMIEVNEPIIKRIYIGSGEDVCLTLLKESK